MIHGAASDFAEDISTVLLLSHCPPQSQTRGDMAGRVAAFGEHSLLDPGPGEWVEELALRALRRRFPSASSAGLESLVRESALSGGGLRSGTEGLLVRAGVRIDTLYLILSGQVERLGRGGVGRASLTAGAIVGERSLALNGISAYDFRPLPGAALFPIPAARWKQFLREASIAGSSRERLELCTQLEALPFFEGIAQSEIAIRAADESTLVALESGTVLATGNGHLWIVLEGCLEILSADSLVETASLGGIFGEEQILDDSCCLFTARVSTPTRCAQIDKSLVEEHPLLLWRAKEVFERRLAAAGAVFDFAWRKEYEVGLDAIDDQHRQIFSAMGAVRQVPGRGGKGLTIALKALTELNNFHFAEEEKILALADYPDLDEHRRAHDRLREDLEAIAKSNKITRETDTFLKDCFLRHTLIFDRRYIPFLEKK